MDDRRLSTGDILEMGITSLPCPKTDIPRNRETFDCENDDFSFIGHGEVKKALEDGKVATSSNYYGIPHAWKEADGIYRGCLLQYRAVTESPTFDDADSAAEWLESTYYATYG